MPPPDKTCATCGRRFSWRRKWADDWDQVRYCSDGCRRHRPRELDRRLEARILELVDGRTGTVCPSEAARSIDPERWRDLMERTRRAGRRLAAEGRVEVTQGGRTVDPTGAKGPIRYRAAR